MLELAGLEARGDLAQALRGAGGFIYNVQMADQNLEADRSGAPAAGPPPAAPAGAQAVPPAEPAAAASSAPDDAELETQRTRARLLDLARADSDNAARVAQTRNDFAQRAEILHKAVPEKYLEIVGALRAAVRSYNDALRQIPDNPIPHCQWYESPNVTLREPYLGDGMRVRLSRVTSHFELVLRFVNRNKKPDVPLIEGYGEFGRDVNKRRVFMRIEGWVEQGAIRYWYNLDFKRQQIQLSQVPDRIVMAVVSSDYSHLSRDYTNDELRPGSADSDGDGPA